MAGNLLDRPGIRRKTLCVAQQISYGNGHLDRFLQLSDRPNRYRRHSNSTFGVHREQFDVDLTICVYFTRILTALLDEVLTQLKAYQGLIVLAS